ncbi:MAG TPA: molybdate ABC transporter permease subunit [Planctomycetota bacterium]|nr:molybdate ABC transporter permease subunit [Planctomycetota bacterium]
MTSALLLSLLVGVCATALVLPPAAALGWLFARKSFAGKSLVETGLMLPLVVPPVVTGWGLLLIFGRRGLLGRTLADADIPIAFTFAGAVLACAVMGFPLAFRACRLAFEQVDPRLESVARTLGATKARAFFAISLPLARGGVVAAAVLAFARCLGEFGATMVFAGNVPGETQTLPLLVYTLLQTPDGFDAAWEPALASVGIAFVLLAAGERALRRGPA